MINKKGKKPDAMGKDGTTSKKVMKSGQSLQAHKQDIDQLFKKQKQQKKEKQAKEEQLAQQVQTEEQEEANKKREFDMQQSGDQYSNPSVHRMDAESGLPVYKYYDLGMNIEGSGFTKDCPFDCNCCH
jgi:uncharacterized protein YpuA (DUF1002 family)